MGRENGQPLGAAAVQGSHPGRPALLNLTRLVLAVTEGTSNGKKKVQQEYNFITRYSQSLNGFPRDKTKLNYQSSNRPAGISAQQVSCLIDTGMVRCEIKPGSITSM